MASSRRRGATSAWRRRRGVVVEARADEAAAGARAAADEALTYGEGGGRGGARRRGGGSARGGRAPALLAGSAVESGGGDGAWRGVRHYQSASSSGVLRRKFVDTDRSRSPAASSSGRSFSSIRRRHQSACPRLRASSTSVDGIGSAASVAQTVGTAPAALRAETARGRRIRTAQFSGIRRRHSEVDELRRRVTARREPHPSTASVRQWRARSWRTPMRLWQQASVRDGAMGMATARSPATASVRRRPSGT